MGDAAHSVPRTQDQPPLTLPPRMGPKQQGNHPPARGCGRAALVRCVLLTLVVACGAPPATGNAVTLPTRRGEVWELDSAETRATSAAALLAFVSGTQTLLVDGDDTFAGMRVTQGGTAPDGGQPLTLGDGDIQATLIKSATSTQLTFSTGERLPLRRRTMEARQ